MRNNVSYVDTKKLQNREVNYIIMCRLLRSITCQLKITFNFMDNSAN